MLLGLNKLGKSTVSPDTPIFIRKDRLFPNTCSPFAIKFHGINGKHPTGNASETVSPMVRTMPLTTLSAILTEYSRNPGAKGFCQFLSDKGLTIICACTETGAFRNQPFTGHGLLLKNTCFRDKKRLSDSVKANASTGKKLKWILSLKRAVGYKTDSSNRINEGIQVSLNDVAFIYFV